jgi:sugar-specific transcriptional regulator TrmB
MGTIGTIALVVGVVVVLALLINRKAVGTLLFNIRSAFGGGARAVDSANAKNNMVQAVEDAQAEIQAHTGKLKESQGQIESLTRSNNEDNSEVARLTAQVQQRAVEVNGNTEDEVLLDLAAQLTKAETRAATSAKNLKDQVNLHNAVLVQVQDAVARAADLEEEAERMGQQLDLSQSRAELAEVGINFQKSGVGGKLAAAEKYKADIQRQIDTNNGAVVVAQQLNPKKENVKTAAWVAQQNAKATLAKLGIGKPAPVTPPEQQG